MGVVVDKLPKSHSGRRPDKYPWDDWMDGRIWKLTRGEDFESEPAKFRNMCIVKAHQRGKRFRTRVDGDDVYLQCEDL